MPAWADYRRKNGLDPLGMQNSSVNLYRRYLPGISWRASNRVRQRDNQDETGGGGPVSEPPPVCIPTRGGDCVTRAVFERTADALVDGYEREDGFRNQWGLAKIGAGRAYANIEVLKGAGIEPGAGVTIGFLDTGIDRDHPAFAGRTVTERFG